MFRFIEKVTKCRLCVLTDQCKANLAWARRKPMLIQSACWLSWKKKDMIKPFSTLPWLIYGNLFYEVYALPYDYMGAFFFGGACRPTPLAVLSSTSIFLDRTYPTSSCVAFTFRRCLYRRKRCLKRYGRDLTVTAHCSIWIYFPFPILLYILILLLMYSNIVV